MCVLGWACGRVECGRVFWTSADEGTTAMHHGKTHLGDDIFTCQSEQRLIGRRAEVWWPRCVGVARRPLPLRSLSRLSLLLSSPLPVTLPAPSRPTSSIHHRDTFDSRTSRPSEFRALVHRCWCWAVLLKAPGRLANGRPQERGLNGRRAGSGRRPRQQWPGPAAPWSS